MKYDYLVNKDYPLDKEFVPDNLELYPEYNGIKYFADYKTYVEKMCLKYFYLMQKDALKNNIHIIIDSAYRSYEYQEKLYNMDKVFTAKPGTSEHQTGLAIDVAVYRNGIYSDDIHDDDIEILWLLENAYKYGFILRYPEDKEDITGIPYEFWHFRYVGLDTALYMHNNNIQTLEEFHVRKR